MGDIKLIMDRYENEERIQDLGFVVPFTNSERMNFACPRLWTLGNVECFESMGHSDAITYGVIWHSLLETILYEIKTYDRVFSIDETMAMLDEILLPTIHRCLIDSGGEEYLNEYINFDKVEPLIDTLKTNVVGWMISWKDIIDSYRVLEIEVPVAAPVWNPLGEVAKFDVYVVEEDEGIRLARTSEAHKARKLRLPFWKVGKIDVVLQCRRTGKLWVCDHKTTSTPSSFDSSIPYDVQLPSYAYLLKYEIQNGSLTQYKDFDVGGIFYDVYKSSANSSPKILKSGKLSTAKNSAVPSWIFEKFVIEGGYPMSQYKNHIQYIKNNVDKRYYLHRFLHLLPSDIERCSAEDFAIATQIAKKRSELVNINKYTYKADFDTIAYRFPLCQRYGNCRFSSICVANNHPAVIDINRTPKVQWVQSHSKEIV